MDKIYFEKRNGKIKIKKKSYKFRIFIKYIIRNTPKKTLLKRVLQEYFFENNKLL